MTLVILYIYENVIPNIFNYIRLCYYYVYLIHSSYTKKLYVASSFVFFVYDVRPRDFSDVTGRWIECDTRIR